MLPSVDDKRPDRRLRCQDCVRPECVVQSESLCAHSPSYRGFSLHIRVVIEIAAPDAIATIVICVLINREFAEPRAWQSHDRLAAILHIAEFESALEFVDFLGRRLDIYG